MNEKIEISPGLCPHPRTQSQNRASHPWPVQALQPCVGNGVNLLKLQTAKATSFRLLKNCFSPPWRRPGPSRRLSHCLLLRLSLVLVTVVLEPDLHLQQKVSVLPPLCFYFWSFCWVWFGFDFGLVWIVLVRVWLQLHWHEHPRQREGDGKQSEFGLEFQIYSSTKRVSDIFFLNGKHSFRYILLQWEAEFIKRAAMESLHSTYEKSLTI